MPSTITTRILIISDTHNYDYEDADIVDGHLRLPVPQCDILLHCGDLTNTGGLQAYEKCLRMMKEVPADLKLVIAGNHDLSLDAKFWRDHCTKEYDPRGTNDPMEHDEAVKLMRGPLAKECGITYLDEGMHSFTLKNGASFTVYASPYQPEFFDWAFPYKRNEDRFNLQQDARPGTTSIATYPIPSFPKVDIMMTHGPPKDTFDLVQSKSDPGLDWTKHGNVGCDNLLHAVSRVRPRLYCFGHIHEGSGAKTVKWKADQTTRGNEAIEKQSKRVNCYPKPAKEDIEFGSETLMVNAAIMDVHYEPVNPPWLIDLELPCEA